MVIDFRLRPPVKSFTNLLVYPKAGKERSGPFAWHSPHPPSVRERSMDKLLAEMKEAGITHALIWGRAVRGHQELSTSNEDIASVVQEYRGIFSGLGGIGVPAWGEIDVAVAEVDRAVKDLGLKGIVIDPGTGVIVSPADDPKLYPVYQRCQDLGGILALTMSRGKLVSQDVSHSNPDAVDRVAGDFPKLKIVVGHAFWPWVTQSCAVAFRRPNIYLLPDAFGMGMPGYMQWVEAANTYLEDRMLFGTTYPTLDVREMVASYQRLPYREGVLEKVMYKNAAKLLGLPV